MAKIELAYGLSGRIELDVPREKLVGVHVPPANCVDLRQQVRLALETPLELPALKQAIVEGDRVVLALDVHTPAAEILVDELWTVCQRCGVRAEDLTILQPASDNLSPPDPRLALPADVQSQVAWKIHTPHDEASHRYLASTAAGERIYLASDLADADFVISVGSIAFDSVLGYRGSNSVVYPGLSNAEASARARGEGHDELEPDDERPLRQKIDEVGWLLGTQYTVQVIAGQGAGVAEVYCGSADAVLRAGRDFLAAHWTISLPQDEESVPRPDLVVVAVESDAGGHGWDQLARALAVAQRLVERGGRIAVVTELDLPLGEGLQLIRETSEPSDALRPIRKLAPADMNAALQVARAVDSGRVYLMSHLDNDLVEDLHLIPLENADELARLIGTAERLLVIGGAQHVHGRVEHYSGLS